MRIHAEVTGPLLMLLLWGIGFLTGFAAARGPREWRDVITAWKHWRRRARLG